MQKLLEQIVAGASGWIELRYQSRSTKRIAVRNGKLEESSSVLLAGLGVRALVDGVFGFASTTDVSKKGILAAIDAAQGASGENPGSADAPAGAMDYFAVLLVVAGAALLSAALLIARRGLAGTAPPGRTLAARRWRPTRPSLPTGPSPPLLQVFRL